MSSQDPLTNNCTSFWNVHARRWNVWRGWVRRVGKTGPEAAGRFLFTWSPADGNSAARGRSGGGDTAVSDPTQLLQAFQPGPLHTALPLLKANFLTCGDFLDGPKPGHLNSETGHTTNLQHSSQIRHQETSILFLPPSRYDVSHPYSSSALRKKIFYFKMWWWLARLMVRITFWKLKTASPQTMSQSPRWIGRFWRKAYLKTTDLNCALGPQGMYISVSYLGWWVRDGLHVNKEQV